MKRATFLLILLAITVHVNAQEFAPIGAIWHYTQGTLDPQVTSFKTLESLSDTMINGVDCKKIVEVGRYMDTTSVAYQYMYSENDSVFFYADGNFQLLYDFGANAGDTIVLNYFNAYDETPLKMIIDSTGTMMVNDQERRIQYITCGDGLTIEFGNSVIEGIGNTNFMFPIYDGTLDGPLRCYQDDSIGLFFNPFNLDSNWNHEDCGEIITGIAERESEKGISIFPNPTKNSITIQNIDSQTAYKIIDTSGKLLLQGIIFESSKISSSELSKGIYFIEFKNENVQTVKKIVLE